MKTRSKKAGAHYRRTKCARKITCGRIYVPRNADEAVICPACGADAFGYETPEDMRQWAEAEADHRERQGHADSAWQWQLDDE